MGGEVVFGGPMGGPTFWSAQNRPRPVPRPRPTSVHPGAGDDWPDRDGEDILQSPRDAREARADDTMVLHVRPDLHRRPMPTSGTPWVTPEQSWLPRSTSWTYEVPIARTSLPHTGREASGRHSARNFGRPDTPRPTEPRRTEPRRAGARQLDPRQIGARQIEARQSGQVELADLADLADRRSALVATTASLAVIMVALSMLGLMAVGASA